MNFDIPCYRDNVQGAVERCLNTVPCRKRTPERDRHEVLFTPEKLYNSDMKHLIFADYTSLRR